MIKTRVIPCLDVKDGRVVKGVNFVALRDAGDPVEQARAYDAAGADELMFLDITASSDNRKAIFDVIARTAEVCFMPVSVGGGVRTVEDARRLLRAGADKVSVNTAAVEDPDLISRLRDGAKTGYDIGLLSRITNAVPVPVIASGGAGSVEHLVEAVKEGGADAVLAASIFHFGEISILEAKAAMKAAGLWVREPVRAA